MPDTYPYMVSNNKIAPIFEKIRAAGKPAKFTYEFLKNLGFASSNDRAFIPLFRKLRFIAADGSPTAAYDRLKDPTQYKHVIGEMIKELYSELFSINENMNSASDDEIKGAIARVTGKDDKAVGFYFATFKALCQFARFDASSHKKTIPDQPKTPPEEAREPSGDGRKSHPDFHYNIQVHLPATTDIAVYNAIFKSLRDNLII